MIKQITLCACLISFSLCASEKERPRNIPEKRSLAPSHVACLVRGAVYDHDKNLMKQLRTHYPQEVANALKVMEKDNFSLFQMAWNLAQKR